VQLADTRRVEGIALSALAPSAQRQPDGPIANFQIDQHEIVDQILRAVGPRIDSVIADLRRAVVPQPDPILQPVTPASFIYFL
jgi:hypothetical protein